ncbi:hypothetical protein [Aeromonas media]|uniref:hypothetical protein n=1 Tax=Aeromonas media TaxID=651 RepID=UPI003D20AC3A
MGSRINELNEERHMLAKEIAADAGCIYFCERHEDIWLEGSASRDEAYRLGHKRLLAGELGKAFSDFDELKHELDLVLQMADERCEECSDPD